MLSVHVLNLVHCDMHSTSKLPQLMKIIKILIICSSLKVRNTLLFERRSILLSYHLPVHKIIYVYTWSDYFMFSLLLLGEMGHQYINIDKRTITNVFMFQKIYKFSNIEQKYVCKMGGGGHMNKKWKTLMTYNCQLHI